MRGFMGRFISKFMRFLRINKEFNQTKENTLRAIEFNNSTNFREVALGLSICKDFLYGDANIGEVAHELRKANIKVEDIDNE